MIAQPLTPPTPRPWDEEGLEGYHLTGNETQTVFEGRGILFGIVVNTPQSGASLTVYDNREPVASGPVKAVVSLANQGTIPYEMRIFQGLTIASSGLSTADVTLMYRSTVDRPWLGAGDGVNPTDQENYLLRRLFRALIKQALAEAQAGTL